MELIDALFDLCKLHPRPIIAIDGPAGAGKTTLAEHIGAALALRYKSTTLHMDDLYHGWDAPFDHHLTDALVQACTSHQKAEGYSLSFFDWIKGQYRLAQEIPQADLLILEGVGSSQAVVRPFLACSIWIEIDAEQGLQRVLTRDGDSISIQMQLWLEKQAQHFLENQSEKSADFVLTT
jgi:uridine kinase